MNLANRIYRIKASPDKRGVSRRIAEIIIQEMNIAGISDAEARAIVYELQSLVTMYGQN